ncbi:glycoside hydrolase family 2 protein [Caballeronia sp. LZ062]|uniref:glycosyl hydrolase 2 galactose-binding domain-containing protein n=1 Tax=unclassified Caballeronia TaxID=2646786 RepID=UPI002856F13B|nr:MULTISPECIES: glycoside hydrolase family 2 protein [unclassified Caballeronia]MDR5856008.1 glycoside hydrolase family 2 protein [Caballeronia sp. LZ050]MDR5872678.1 glycoside hydrolase family 2 protein [Caballeronia sp. LZ062]
MKVSPFSPLRLDAGWQCVSTPAAAYATPMALDADMKWLDAPVPGTVASAHRAAGMDDESLSQPYALSDHWYRLTLHAEGKRRLRFNGLATIAEVWIDDSKVLESDSMFIAHDVDHEFAGPTAIHLCFRSIAPALAAKRGRARWRPRLAQPATLRNVRTTLLGHMPGWCPTVQPAGPWRAVELIGESPASIDSVDLTTSVDGGDGIVDLSVRFYHAQAPDDLWLECGDASAKLTWKDAHTATGRVRVPQARLWWPHTHGQPARYTVRLVGALEADIALGNVGFRTITVDRGADNAGFTLVVNDVPVFARGACWTSADIIALDASRDKLDSVFKACRRAGLNIIRVSGTTLYESDTFYELADENGILVWQDFAFANFDYPSDERFQHAVQQEAEQFLARTRRFASLSVLCGGSEVHQQAAMFGLPFDAYQQPLFTELLPAIVAAMRPDVPYVVNSPSAAPSDMRSMPFGTRGGITHYYGVGAYQRSFDDARRAAVRFASECLAFANVPDDVALRSVPNASRPHEPRWKAGVPRDPGAAWDFDDVREHYLRTVYGADVARLRYEDPERYLTLSRAVVAEVMGAVFSEWRRKDSSCSGGIVWNLLDVRTGAGWGIIDVHGVPKSPLHGLARVLQPVQVTVTDEGLDGLDVHVINETAHEIRARLELSCLRDGVVKVASGSCELTLLPRCVERVSSNTLIGAFFDITYAYRFGPRAHDATHVVLRDIHTGQVLSEAFHFPDLAVADRCDPGLSVGVEKQDERWCLDVTATRLARWVHVVDPNYYAEIDWFHIAPGSRRRIPLIARRADVSSNPEGDVFSINAMAGVSYRA